MENRIVLAIPPVDKTDLCAKGFALCKVQYQETLILKDAYGKPFLNSGPEFNYSDCRSANGIAFSDQEVGIDLEAKRKVSEHLLSRLPEEEQKLIADSVEPNRIFLILWTLRESYVKMTGRGLSKEVFERSFAGAAKQLLAENESVFLSKDEEGAYYQRIFCPSPDVILAISSRSKDGFDIVFYQELR